MRNKLNSGFLTTVRRLIRERRGVSAVEFALLLPFMLTLYLGGTEITQAITIKRKTTIVTRTIGDFVAQSSTINNAQMLNIMNATKAVVSPYSQGNLKIVVTSVGIDAANNATVVWSDATANGTAKTPGTAVTLPTGLNAFPNTTVIWTEAEYVYTPAVGWLITGNMTLGDHMYMRPRLVAKVCRDTGVGTPVC
jgi:Flp pilus assembly protein TadG